jgi:hypothetical protein
MPRRDHLRPERSRIAVWAARVFGLLGAAAVLAVGVLVLTMVLPADDDQGVAAAPVATATPAPTKAGSRKKAAAKRLTGRQRTERRRAADEVRRQGYSPVSLADYRADHVLRVLVGQAAGSTPAGRRAFFFVGKRYIGLDATSASGHVRVGRELERQITLVYTLYKPGDRLCCPKGRVARVHFRWTGTALEPREPIPPAFERRPASSG